MSQSTVILPNRYYISKIYQANYDSTELIGACVREIKCPTMTGAECTVHIRPLKSIAKRKGKVPKWRE